MAPQQVRVEVGTWTPESEAAAAPAPSSVSGTAPGGTAPGGLRLGVGVTPMTPDLASQLGVPSNTQGVAVEAVDPDGAAAQAGIQPGDIIQQVNHQPVRSVADLAGALARTPNTPPLLLVNRAGQAIFIAVPPVR